ncbi:MAG TPA: hypothetical protein VN920_17500 [Pyrinomonadaceae bacterium]|nr:hypothetical protein [Pyrinomonadaceae bacterium]
MNSGKRRQVVVVDQIALAGTISTGSKLAGAPPDELSPGDAENIVMGQPRVSQYYYLVAVSLKDCQL